MLFLFYSFIGSMFGPIVGIMLASYFVERGRTLDLAGIYADYRGGEQGSLPAYNWRALGVLLLSFVVTMAGRVPGVSSVEFLAQVNNLAFFSGLIIGFVGYTLTILATRRRA
jgi:allantoin permease